VNIFLVEDDKETSAHIVVCLNGAGHDVTVCYDGLEALSIARQCRHALLIVDRILPGLDGLSLVKQLRAEGNQTPVLFLTTMSGLNDRVEGLKGGGDDYLVKPFAFSELLARVNVVARRSTLEREPVCLRAADLEMNLIRRSVQRAGKPIELQPQEFRLLEYLMRNMGQPLSHRMLLQNVWDLDFDPQTNLVATHISRLRDKMDRGYDKQLIHTVRGVGYVLRDQ
jgi:two-component system OmpR family response regulator